MIAQLLICHKDIPDNKSLVEFGRDHGKFMKVEKENSKPNTVVEAMPHVKDIYDKFIIITFDIK